MSKNRIISNAILAVLLLIGTSVYFWALDFVNTNLGINFSQAVDHDVAAWQFTVWVMSILLAWVIVFIGAAKNHPNLEPIASGCFLAFTIVSFFIGCSILTLNFPFSGFGSLSVQATIDPSKLMAMFGGGGSSGGGSFTIPAITVNIGLFQLLVITMSTIYAVLLFLRTLLKSRRETETSSTSSKTSKPDISYTPLSAKKEDGSMDFMKNVRKD